MRPSWPTGALPLLCAVAAAMLPGGALAQEETGGPAAPGPTAPGLFERETLTGDWGGARDALERAGVTLDLAYVGEVFGNPVGGERRGAAWLGVLQAALEVDLEKAAGWSGAVFHTNAYQIHGRGLTAGHVGNLLLLSDVEARPATRLATLWLEQSVGDDAFSVRAGRLAVDDEFLVSAYAAPLVNSTFGWPGITGLDLPSGGPAYPFAAPGVRVRWMPADGLSVMAAVFGGGPHAGDASGTSFALGGGPFAIAELGYAAGSSSGEPGAAGGRLPANYKIGVWYHGDRFDDQRRDTLGLSLADPASSGEPAARRGDFGAYAVIDQMLWRRPGSDQGLGSFLRVAGAPGDRNLVDFYADAGLGCKGLLPGRENDTATLGFAYARISDDARRRDLDFRAFSGTAAPVRDFEAVLELTYQAVLAPWLVVQPDVQYVFHPGGGGARSADPAASIPDALVIGLRTTLKL